MVNTISEKKLSFAKWKKSWKKRHCRECDTGVPNPLVCYVCMCLRWERFFDCAKCGCYRVIYEQKVCGGAYNTGACLCAKCRALIQAVKVCHDYYRGGYCEGHMIHQYSDQEIAREVKFLFRGENLWVKIFCRFCGQKIAGLKLGCACWQEQTEHEHKYSSEKCLECYAAYSKLERQLDVREWKEKYQEYSRWWTWQREIVAYKSIRQAYEFYGVGGGYWAKCSFCEYTVKGQETHKKPLEKNLVQFWTRDKKDGRLICDYCLVRREVVRELRIEKKVVAYWLRQGFNKCEICEKKLVAALRHGQVKNRNQAFSFWGLKKIREKILCLACIRDNYREQLTIERRKVLTKYLKRGYV